MDEREGRILLHEEVQENEHGEVENIHEEAELVVGEGNFSHAAV